MPSVVPVCHLLIKLFHATRRRLDSFSPSIEQRYRLRLHALLSFFHRRFRRGRADAKLPEVRQADYGSESGSRSRRRKLDQDFQSTASTQRERVAAHRNHKLYQSDQYPASSLAAAASDLEGAPAKNPNGARGNLWPEREVAPGHQGRGDCKTPLGASSEKQAVWKAPLLGKASDDYSVRSAVIGLTFVARRAGR